jgi:hypothetical protein
MRSTGYAAVWQDGGPVMAGRVQLVPNALIFEGAGRGRQASRRIRYGQIAALRLGRGSLDRIGGRPALVLELRDGETIRVAMPELGALHEFADALHTRGSDES